MMHTLRAEPNNFTASVNAAMSESEPATAAVLSKAATCPSLQIHKEKRGQSAGPLV